MPSDWVDVPEDVLKQLRVICDELPGAVEGDAWAGRRWRVGQRTFAHAVTSAEANGELNTRVVFRALPAERDALVAVGYPFRLAAPNYIAMRLEGDVDWDEVDELITESFCSVAPKKLAAQVHAARGVT
jgi:predicted DNA-binding protein (MmcQ/YjbR family)